MVFKSNGYGVMVLPCVTPAGDGLGGLSSRERGRERGSSLSK
jgi:hypothetical protein